MTQNTVTNVQRIDANIHDFKMCNMVSGLVIYRKQLEVLKSIPFEGDIGGC